MIAATTQGLGKDSRIPIYHRLRDEFFAKISSRAWEPNEALPSEINLAEQYGTAPGTVRKAIEILVNEGFLERRQGKGTFVRKANFDNSLLRFFKFHPDSGELIIPKSKIITRDVIPAKADIAEKLEIKENEPVIYMLRQRIIDDVPVIVQDIWLPHDLFKDLLEIAPEHMGDMLYPLYEEQCGHVIAMAKEDLRAMSVKKKYSKLLKIKPSEPVIVIDRLALGFDQKVLELRRSHGRADKYHYSVEIH